VRRLSPAEPLRVAAAAALIAVAARLVYGPGALGYDASWALAWGDEITRLHTPTFDAELAPTPHPLANALGAVASLFGEAGPDVVMVVSYAAFGLLGVAAYVVGRRSFGVAAGVAFAAILLTRPLLVNETLQAAIDVPFLALVLTAMAVELGEERAPGVAGRRATRVLVLLALAGLLRPEAWPLSLAYAAWALREHRAAPPRVVSLALAAPVLWLLHDLLLAGDPFHSLRETQDLAALLERASGLERAVDIAPDALRSILGSAVVGVGLVVGAVALVVAQERARLPVAVLALGVAGFLVLGVADLPLRVRYLIVPAAMLALLCAAGVAAFEWLPRFGLAASAAAAIVLAFGVSSTYDEHQERADEVAAARSSQRSLEILAEAVARRGLTPRCHPIRVATYGAVPQVAFHLGADPSRVMIGAAPEARSGIVFAATDEARVADLGPALARLTSRGGHVLPRGFERIAVEGWWAVGARC
jgi:hypothetical protein